MIVDTIKGDIVLNYGNNEKYNYAILYDKEEDSFHCVNLEYVSVVKKDIPIEQIFNIYVKYYGVNSYEKLKEFGIIKEEEKQQTLKPKTKILNCLGVTVTYVVILNDVEVPVEVYNEFMDAFANGDQIGMFMSKYDKAVDWINSNITESDSSNWEFEISEID